MITFVGHFLFYYPQGHFMVYKGQDSTTQLLWVLYASLSYPSWIVLGRQNLRLIQQAASNGIIIIAEIYHFLSDSSVLIEFFDTCPLVVNVINLAYSFEINMLAVTSVLSTKGVFDLRARLNWKRGFFFLSFFGYSSLSRDILFSLQLWKS